MLVLSRRRDETIMIGDEIEITIVDIKGDTVRVGINAPRAVSVHRKEIYDAIKQENIDNVKKQQLPNAAALDNLAKLVGGAGASGGASAAKLSKLQPSQLPQTASLAQIRVAIPEAKKSPSQSDKPDKSNKADKSAGAKS